MGNADLRGWGICYFHGVDAKNVGATGKSPLRYQNIHLTMVGDADGERGFSRMGNADLRGWGIWYFHGVDAKNVGATGKSPLRYQNIHLTMVGDADGGRGFTRM
jgi:hypothetical protein